jgi:hypothetical protein
MAPGFAPAADTPAVWVRDVSGNFPALVRVTADVAGTSWWSLVTRP